MKNLPPNKTILKRSKTDQSGVALAIVALVLLMLTVLIISSHYTLISQIATTGSYRYSTQAFYVAEAGVQRSIDFFSHQYTPPTPGNVDDWGDPSINLNTGVYPNQFGASKQVVLDSRGPTYASVPAVASKTTLEANFQTFMQALNSSTPANNALNLQAGLDGGYTVQATLLSSRTVSGLGGTPTRVERWRISSVGTIRNTVSNANNLLAKAENVAVIETITNPYFSNAICAKNIIGISSTVNSYNSAQGPYNPGNPSNGPASVGSFQSPIGTGPFNVSVGGTINVPPTFPGYPGLCGQATGGCGTNYCPAPATVPNFVVPATGTAVAVGGVYTAAPCTSTCTLTVPPAAVGTCPAAPVAPCNTCLASLPSGSTVTVPAGATGPYCFWINDIPNGDITFDNKPSATRNGTLNIFINTLSLSGNKSLIINASSSNPVNIWVQAGGGLSMNGTPGINVTSGGVENPPGWLTIFGASGPPTGYTILTNNGGGNEQFSAVIYAPTADISGGANMKLMGAAIVNDFNKGGGGNSYAGVHFDTELQNNTFTVGNFLPNTEVRRIY